MPVVLGRHNNTVVIIVTDSERKGASKRANES